MNFVIPFCFVFVLSVNANQATVPVQLCPAYQQSAYNPPAVAPVVYQTTATSYNNPCAQYTVSQNQLPTQIANSIVSKVLSNPTIHKILDPKIRFYNQNGVEFQKQMYNQQPVPNIINNYFIVPPEFLKFNETEFNTISPLPSAINNGVNNDIVNNVEILTNIPQHNSVTKENLIKVNQDTSQISKTNQRHTPRRKIQRKKGKKLIKNKLFTSQSIAKANSSYITTSHNENKAEDQEESKAFEDIKNKTSTQNHDDIEYDFKETTADATNQNSHDLNNDRERKKKSKKRRKSAKNATSASYTGEISNDNILNNKVTTEIITPHVSEIEQNITKETITQDYNMNNGQSSSDSFTKELNEDCIKDITSLINCLSDCDCDGRVPRNSRDEAIWRDFRQNFPDVPENLARSMLAFAQNQYQNPVNSNYYYPSLPFTFDQIYQMPNIYNYGRTNIIEKKPKSRSRRRKHKKRKAKNKKQINTNSKTASKFCDIKLLNTDTEDYSELITPLIDDFNTDTISTTENPNLQMEEVTTHVPTAISTLVTEVFLSTTKETPSDYDYNKNIELENTQERYEEVDLGYHENERTELGEEDTVPVIYTNGIIDDYYPTFYDNAYYANDHEYTVADINDRYYYTTDRNIENVIRDIRKFESLKEAVPKILKKTFKDTVPKHTYFDADRESYKNLIKGIVPPKSQFKPQIPPKVQEETFKTPPALENPDFKTKRITKETLKAEDYRIDDSFDDVAAYFDYAEKSSIYSNAKTPFYTNKAKPNSEMGFVLERPVKSSKSEVETSFARSKVAKYGLESDVRSLEFSKFTDFEDDEVSVVTAQSLVYPEEFW